MPYDDTSCPHCRRLRAELEETQETIRQLQEMMFLDEQSPIEFQFTALEEAAYYAILKSSTGFATREYIYDQVYGLRPNADQPEPKIIDVIIWKIRKKLRPHGLEIKTVWGRGYHFTEDSKQRLRNWDKKEASEDASELPRSMENSNA